MNYNINTKQFYLKLTKYSNFCCRDESLGAHVNFLESLGIAGVSHHSLLFSKTACVQVVNIEEEEIR